MAISPKLRSFMDRRGVGFDEVPHTLTMQMSRAAQAADVPSRQVAKGVLVRAGDEYMLAVAPSSRRVRLEDLQSWLGRRVTLAEEGETLALFPDCALGAIPAIGQAYGLETIVDNGLMDADDVWFEGGDHKTLVHVEGPAWRRLVSDASHCTFSA
jgi:Ala-tRNA(Pro) deacylase